MKGLLPLEPVQKNRCRIVLTGGPGGGKTTAADLFRREIGERVVIVPEAATLLFTGGFPRAGTPLGIHAVQRAVYHVQRNLEDTQAALFPGRILLCDRGTVDGAAYWPDESHHFFQAVGGVALRKRRQLLNVDPEMPVQDDLEFLGQLCDVSRIGGASAQVARSVSPATVPRELEVLLHGLSRRARLDHLGRAGHGVRARL